MTLYQIEVRAVSEQHDVQAQRLARDILHVPALQGDQGDQSPQDDRGPQGDRKGRPYHTSMTIRTAQLYRFRGQVTSAQVSRLVHELLLDPVVQTAHISGQQQEQSMQSMAGHVVDVFFHPGVTDTLAESVLAGAQMLGITGLERVETGRRYVLDARLSADDVRAVAEALLYNPVIQYFVLRNADQNVGASHMVPACDSQSIIPLPPSSTVPDSAYDPKMSAINRAPTISISTLSDERLLEISKNGLLALNRDEMRAIQQYYREQGREPTDVELEAVAQTWSEHCSHKTFKATINYREVDSAGNVVAHETISSLLKHSIMQATEQVKRPWVVSAFSDNAGILRFTEEQDIAFKVETHNHPSAIEPFGGANTGVGGVIRDVLGVSAQPIACTDILCFGPPATPAEQLPPGILSPRRIASGVVDGVRDYGNKMGIPTVNGAVLYHPGYLYNPLVFCGCLGILPHGSHPRNVRLGDKIVVLGGRTGRDGIHGATFSSSEMSSEMNAQVGSAVQIGAPITEKKVADVVIQARDLQLYSAITDCGAGGFSSAIGEMGAEMGASVELEHAPLKYQGLAPWEIWLSEAQERMVLAVPPAHLEALLAICAIEEVEASIIGTFTDNHRLVVTYQGQVVADIAMEFLHHGQPTRTLEAVWTNVGARFIAPRVPLEMDASEPNGTQGAMNCAPTLLSILRHPSIASKEHIVRRYDHEVQGATVLKPLVGRSGNGPGDAAVLQPILVEQTQAGIVLSNGINPLYGSVDPYHMATNAVDEALRNLTAVGGDIERAALLDNFCWGNPTDPMQLGLLVRAVKGCHDAAIGFGTPFISGKDSLNNEYRHEGQRLPVLPTLLISAVGVIDDAAQTIDMALKVAGNVLYQVGITRNELTGSFYAEMHGVQAVLHTSVPQVHLSTARRLMQALGAAIRKGLVCACHDLSEGGLAAAAAEMSLAGLLGADIDVRLVPASPFETQHDLIALFSESASRFLVEIAPEQQAAFEAHIHAAQIEHLACIGKVTDTSRFCVRGDDQLLIDLTLDELQAAWKGEQA